MHFEVHGSQATMDKPDSTRLRFAVLIGVNAYAKRPLMGCERDVQEIKEYLERIPNAVHVEMLSTAYGDDSGFAQDRTLWPTYGNITSSLEKVTSLANAGDFVYIHYSGHGTRMEPCDEYGNKCSGDLALDLLEGSGGSDIRYLRGLELAYLLDNMVKKGLLVTLVLDCCFSGCVMRHGDYDGIRSLPYDAEVDKVYPPDPIRSTGYRDGRPIYRDGAIQPNWIIDADGYTILTACGPHEIARELKSADGHRQGALSYFLLSTLKQFGDFRTTQQNLHRHLGAIFRQYQSTQNPMLFGNKNLTFFGGPQLKLDSATISVVRHRNGSLRLQAGQAHGVCNGDQFVLRAFHSANADSSHTIEDPVIAKVIKSGGLTSELELLVTSHSQTDVQTGWTARAITRLLLREFPVQLMAGLPYLELWIRAAKARTSLDIHTTQVLGYPFSFHLTQNANNNYEILDESNNVIITVPGAIDERERDMGHLLDLISHLVEFKFLRGLTNNLPSPTLKESYSAYLVHTSGETTGAGSIAMVKDDDTLFLETRNTGDRPLYLHIYNMTPRWEIVNILKDFFEVIPPHNTNEGFTGICRKKLRMNIPRKVRDAGRRECEDILKVFITSQPTCFNSLELPDIEGQLKGKASLNLIGDSRQASSTSPSASEDWVALSFVIHVIDR
jgi:hypothetical protein